MKKILLMVVSVLFTQGYISSTQAADVTNIRIDGSSTVYLLTEAVAEEFQKGKSDVRVTVGVSGTGGGFKKFTANEIDIADASRKIEPGEIAKAKENKIDYTEFEVAYDGIAVVVSSKNAFANSFTVDELKQIWEPNSKVKKWSDLKKEWPTELVHLYGPGADSGTFDYFTKAIVGKEKSIRSDFTSSENDNVLVQGVSGDANAMGYFGYAYYKENASRLKLVGIAQVAGKPPIVPTPANIKDGTYKPLSRPLYLYVNNKSLQEPKVKEFVKYYLQNAASLASDVGYIPLENKLYSDQVAKLK